MRLSRSLVSIIAHIVAVIWPWSASSITQLSAPSSYKARFLLAGVLCLVLGSSEAIGQSEQWQDHNDAGTEAYRRGNYVEAEKQLVTALTIAEGIGTENPEVATSLSNLALLYDAQGRYDEAEPLYRRALAIQEKTLDPNDPFVAISLTNLGHLYRIQGRYSEAEPLYKRSLAIW